MSLSKSWNLITSLFLFASSLSVSVANADGPNTVLGLRLSRHTSGEVFGDIQPGVQRVRVSRISPQAFIEVSGISFPTSFFDVSLEVQFRSSNGQSLGAGRMRLNQDEGLDMPVGTSSIEVSLTRVAFNFDRCLKLANENASEEGRCRRLNEYLDSAFYLNHLQFDFELIFDGNTQSISFLGNMDRGFEAAKMNSEVRSLYRTSERRDRSVAGFGDSQIETRYEQVAVSSAR
jgi:hypothetical protein